MSYKAKNKGMIATMLASLLLIFGGYMALHPSVAKASRIEPAEAMDKMAEDAKIALNMKLAEKDLEDLLKDDSSSSRFFSPLVNRGFFDRDLLLKNLLLRQALLDGFNNRFVVAKPFVSPFFFEDEPFERPFLFRRPFFGEVED